MILCCGEALIDMIPSQHEPTFIPLAGDAVFNTATGIGRQGVDVGLVSGVSKDLFGEILVNTLKDSTVNTLYLCRADRPTTLAFVTFLDGEANYAFYDENTAAQMLFPDDMAHTFSNDIEALFLQDISLMVGPCAAADIAFLNKKKGSRLIMADPNIRPAFISDEMRYRARVSEVFANCDIFKISIEDLDWISPKNKPRDKKALDILKQGLELLCLTLGAKGVKVYDINGPRFNCSVPQITVEDTVGAGKAFNAGLLVSLKLLNVLFHSAVLALSQNVLKNAVRFAIAFASDNATLQGSDPAWNFIAP